VARLPPDLCDEEEEEDERSREAETEDEEAIHEDQVQDDHRFEHTVPRHLELRVDASVLQKQGHSSATLKSLSKFDATPFVTF
jgi:hypothetical protein